MALYEISREYHLGGFFSSFVENNTWTMEADSEKEIVEMLSKHFDSGEFTITKVIREPVLTITGQELRKRAKEQAKQKALEERQNLYLKLKQEFEPSSVNTS